MSKLGPDPLVQTPFVRTPWSRPPLFGPPGPDPLCPDPLCLDPLVWTLFVWTPLSIPPLSGPPGPDPFVLTPFDHLGPAPGVDPGFGQGGGPSKYFPIFADGAERRSGSEASIYRPGSRARLRALEALVFLSVKYAFSHFSWHLFFKIFNL